MESFAVTCPLAPDTSHLRSGSCTSSRVFGSGFLQTPPHGVALAFLLAFGSAITWQEDFHLFSSVPSPAHTLDMSGSRRRAKRAGGCPLDGRVSQHAAPLRARCEARVGMLARRQAVPRRAAVGGHVWRLTPAVPDLQRRRPRVHSAELLRTSGGR
jgi:hypothetical protein